MISKVQAGLSLLEKELSQLNIAVGNIENNEGSLPLLDKSLINKIADNLSNLQLPNEINKLTTYSNSLSQKIQNIQTKLEYLESNLDNKTTSLGNEISKEMSTILTGVNNTNHYLMSLVNENEKRYNEMEDRLNDINKKNSTNFWLINTLVIFIILFVAANFEIIF